jgi:hypothetical protein
MLKSKKQVASSSRVSTTVSEVSSRVKGNGTSDYAVVRIRDIKSGKIVSAKRIYLLAD